jgi:hypothetical protein
MRKPRKAPRPQERALVRRREQIRRERGTLPESERDHWYRIDGPGEDWQTSVRFVIRDGRPVVAQLRVTPFQAYQWSEPMDIPRQGLTASDLRKIHIQWDDDLHAHFAEKWSEFGAEVAVSRRRAGRYERKDDDWYAEKAVDYLNALRQAPSRPNAWLAEQYGRQRQRVTRNNVRDYVHGARVRGFLTSGRQGWAGAEPTDKLRAWAKTRGILLPKPRRKEA